MSLKSPQEVFNRISAAKTEVELDQALTEIDTLDAKDQREVADSMEKELIETMPPRDVIEEMKLVLMLEKAFKGTSLAGEEATETVSDIRSLLKLFNKVVTIKGDKATNISRDMAAGFAALSDEQKKDLPSLARVLIQASEKHYTNNRPKP